MIRKGGHRFSEKIIRKQKAKARLRFDLKQLRFSDDLRLSCTTTVVDGLPVQALPTSWPVENSRSVAAEWRDGLLDAGGDTKRLSRAADGHTYLKRSHRFS